MSSTRLPFSYTVNCRVGSLEIDSVVRACIAKVNCRVGSLESKNAEKGRQIMVNCRVGSLETLPI